MKLKSSLIAMIAVFFSVNASAYSLWQRMETSVVPVKGKRIIVPTQYMLLAAGEADLKTFLAGITDNPDQSVMMDLPMPDGTMRSFRIWTNHTMEHGLSAKYPDLHTLTATAENDARVTAKIDYTLKGFHAMIFDGFNTIFIDPYSNVAEGYYISYYKQNYTRNANDLMVCGLHSNEDAQEENALVTESGLPKMALKTVNGSILRKYRLALACTGEYATAVGGPTPSKTSVLSAMVTSINRVNGVYERELGVTMQLIANTDTLIYLNGATDPYANLSGDSMLDQNQANVTTIIGSANFDIGHVFSTGGGGIAQLASVCRNTTKARGVTGSASPTGDSYDIDYVAHEMGHQFGSNHTFNNNMSGSCSGNAVSSMAYEPGAGTTIMAYAGICSPDNTAMHSDAYFHAASLVKIITNINSSTIASCPVITVSGNKAVGLAPFTASYNIPYKTPFELTAPVAVDSIATTDKTYCWEQWNLGDYGARFANTFLRGPIFRSFSPDTSRTRVFPALVKLLANTTNYLGEKVPDTARFLTFKLTARSFFNGVGSVHFADDTVHLNVINTGAPFLVTSPNLATVSWGSGGTQTVTWNVAGTTAAPISCATVDIYLSVDGGYTYPYLLSSGVPNSGTATVTVPNITTTKARVKVKGTGNVFFDLSNFNFTITNSGVGISNTAALEGVTVYPNPATTAVTIKSHTTDELQAMLMDVTGKLVATATIKQSGTINVAQLAKGIYYIKVSNMANGQNMVQKVLLQ